MAHRIWHGAPHAMYFSLSLHSPLSLWFAGSPSRRPSMTICTVPTHPLTHSHVVLPRQIPLATGAGCTRKVHRAGAREYAQKSSSGFWLSPYLNRTCWARPSEVTYYSTAQPGNRYIRSLFVSSIHLVEEDPRPPPNRPGRSQCRRLVPASRSKLLSVGGYCAVPMARK